MSIPSQPDNPARRQALAAAALAGSSLWLPATARAHMAPVLTTRSGRLQGRTHQGIHRFLGIPYGADTAHSRFQPPRREPGWQGIRQALEYGPSAPQNGNEGPGSEDCLYLNLWTPSLGQGRRPILVYVHGGGFNNGSGSDPLYDGTHLCLAGDVVVVTVNHRLNVFGYLHLGDLDPDLADAGNAGQLDLIAALHWVREHAEAIGGDVDNITLFGQSGGGAKIATLMAMPAARGLFHRAWTMSGQQVTAAGPRAATQRARLLLEHLGLRRAADLRTLPAEKLLAAATTVRDPSRVENMSLYLGPVLDGHHLPVHPFWPQAPSQSAAIPMVIGNTRDETRAFLGNDPANHRLDWESLPARLEAQQYVDLPVSRVIAFYRATYPHYSPSEVFFAATTAGRSWRGAVEELEARARQGAPTWAYQLDWYDRQGGKAALRAFHTLDIPLVFANTHLPGAGSGDGPGARRAAAWLSTALLHFARHGTPQAPGLEHWTPWQLPQRSTLVLDDQPVTVDDPRRAEREFWHQGPFLQRGTA